jgi:septum formation protein
MTFILASGSPRRLELLRQIGIEPEVKLSNYNEEMSTSNPAELVMSNAVGKGQSVLPTCNDDDVVIAADTIVVLDNMILGKPKNSEEALKMLNNLSGRTHEVFTGVAVFYKGKKKVEVEKTSVKFRKLTDKEIQAYVKTGDPLDKAGAYGIQGRGAIFINSIAGCYNNVVGLPLTRLYTLFAELDVTLYDELPNQGITTGRST